MLRVLVLASCCVAGGAAAQAPALFVAAGDYHACAAMRDGSVRCWGLDERGQCGAGTTGQASAPVVARGIRDATAFALGFEHSCALRADGSVWCWGDGYLDAHGRPAPATRIDGVTATSIVAGQGVTYAVTRDGHVQLWSGTNVTTVAGVDDVVAMAAYGRLACAVRRDGTVWCWAPEDPHYPSTPTAVPGLQNVIALTIGTTHTYARRRDGSVLEAETSVFAMRDGGVWDRWVADGLRARPTAVRAAVCDRVACALLPHGATDCWRDPRPAPYDDETWVAIDQGPNRPARMEPGAPRSERGMAQLLELLPRLTSRVSQCSYSDIRHVVDCGPAGPYETYRFGLEPVTRDHVLPFSLHDVTIDAGSWHSCALDAAGTVQCWGTRTDGELGTTAACPGPSASAPWQLDRDRHAARGDATWCPSPVAVALQHVTHLAVGSTFSCARTANGAVHCWGDDVHGQLGDGGGHHRGTPMRVPL